MDDVALLRRTVHRCTALLILAIGAAVESITTGPSPLAVLLIVGTTLYLLVSFVVFGSDLGTTARTDGE
jgi:hypothetical protein